MCVLRLPILLEWNDVEGGIESNGMEMEKLFTEIMEILMRERGLRTYDLVCVRMRFGEVTFYYSFEITVHGASLLGIIGLYKRNVPQINNYLRDSC
jgi:hypothetical protein